MSVFDEKRNELEKYEFMMGMPRGRLAVTMDLLTDALVLLGQHGVYCRSNSNPTKPARDIESALKSINQAKELIGTVMEDLRMKQDANSKG